MALKSVFNFLAVLSIFSTLPENSFGAIQAIAFFKDYDCPFSGQKQTFTETNDIFKGSWIEDANSAFIVGLWKISMGSSNAVVHYNTEPPHGRCVNRTEWPGNPKILWVEKLGPSDIMSSQIIFFTEEFYTGLSYKVDTEEMGELPLENNPRPLVMRSFIQFSKDSWTSYPEKNFGGKALQFEASRTAEDPYNSYTFNESMLVVVGSVKKVIPDLKSGAGSYAFKGYLELMTLYFIVIVTRLINQI